MGRNRKDLSTTSKVAGSLSFAALARSLKRSTVEEEIEREGCREKRIRMLPSYLVVYYVVAMCIYGQVGVCEVLRWVLDEARGMFGLGEVRVATSGGISMARQRLGEKVMEALYRRVVGPVAVEATRGAWYAGKRVTAVDGSTLDLQDTSENAGHYGYAETSRGECAFPKLRFVTLVEVGTHVLFAARMAPYKVSEQALAAEVITELTPDMLCMADRLFYGYEFWRKARATGADLLWRVKGNLGLPVEERLPDGSYLTTIYAGTSRRERADGGDRVRVVEYRLTGEGAPEETYRLLTTLLDHELHPARDLAELYPQRWEIEITYDEFKTHLRGGRVVLRSKTPRLVEQEFYAFLLAHYCLRHLMHEAALANGVPPLRLSYKHAVEVLKRRLPAYEAGFSPSGRR